MSKVIELAENKFTVEDLRIMLEDLPNNTNIYIRKEDGEITSGVGVIITSDSDSKKVFLVEDANEKYQGHRGECTWDFDQ